MTDTDLGNVFYNITANDQTSGTLAGAAQNFYFMFNSIREGVSMVQTAFDDTVGAAMDYEDSIEHLSITTNTSFDDVQRWKEAATSMGVDFDAFSSTMTMMTQKIGAQGTAGDDLRQRIEALGVSVIDANGNYRSTSDIMQDLLPALSNVGDAQTRDADALAIFGRSWQNIAPMIDDGTTAVNNFKAASPVMSDEDAQKVQNFRIEWGILSERFEIFQDTVGTYIIAFFQDVAQAGAVAGVEISSLGMALDGVGIYQNRQHGGANKRHGSHFKSGQIYNEFPRYHHGGASSGHYKHIRGSRDRKTAGRGPEKSGGGSNKSRKGKCRGSEKSRCTHSHSDETRADY